MASADIDVKLDALVPYLQPGSSYFAAIVDQLLNGDGYAVLRAVLSEAECREEVDRTWDYVTKVTSRGRT